MDTRSLLSTLQEKSAALANQIKHVVPFITWWSHIFQSEVSVTQHIIIATNINKHFYFLIRTWTWLFSRRSEMPLKKFSFVFYTYSNFHSFFCFVFFVSYFCLEKVWRNITDTLRCLQILPQYLKSQKCYYYNCYQFFSILTKA